MKKKNYIWIIAVVAILIAIDQIIKLQISKNLYNSSMQIIEGIVSLTYTENRGVAFGLWMNKKIILITVNIVILMIITHFIIAKKEEVDKLTLISLPIILGGGFGNLIDRIFRGYVIDYIDITQIIEYPVFNFADICVFIGVTLILIRIIIDIINQRKERI